MRARLLWLTAVILAIVAPTAAGACGSDRPAAGTTTTDASTTTAAHDATTTAPAATTTNPAAPTSAAPAPTAVFPTPDAGGTALYAAWTTANRVAAGALDLAPPAELDKLFAAKPVGPKNRGCDAGSFGTATCFFGNGQGGVNVELGPAPGGWSITSIDPFG